MITNLALTGYGNKLSSDRLIITKFALTGCGSRLSFDRLIITELALTSCRQCISVQSFHKHLLLKWIKQFLLGHIRHIWHTNYDDVQFRSF